MIAVGLDPAFLRTLFAACTPEGTISNSYGLHNEEFGAPVLVCRGPTLPLDALWPRLFSEPRRHRPKSGQFRREGWCRPGWRLCRTDQGWGLQVRCAHG